MKKKLITVLTALMVLSFSTTAFAAGSPNASNASQNTQSSTTTTTTTTTQAATPSEVKAVPATVTANTAQTAKVSTEVEVKTPAAYVETTKATATVNGKEVAAPSITAVSETTVNSAVEVVKEQLKDVANIANNFIGGTKGAALANAAANSNVSIKTEVKSVVEVSAPAGVTVSAANPITLTFNVDGITADSYVMILHYNGTAWESISATTGNGTVTATFTSLSPIAIVQLEADTSAVTSPKTGAAMPAAAVIAVICAAGVVVCTRKVKFN